METKLISVRELLRSKLKHKADRIPSFAVNYLIRLIHQDELNDILTRYSDLQGVDFMQALVEDYFRVKLIVENDLPAADGRRYIFVSNHPLGGFDGICLSYLLGRHYEGQVKCFVNDLLLHIPNLRSIFLPVNKHGLQSRETAIISEEAYRSDNQILTFPAGLCSRRQGGLIRDLEWKKSFVQKAIKHQRDVVPIYFRGSNSRFFYGLANLRKLIKMKINLEMLLLPHELFKLKDKTFEIIIGKPVSYELFASGGQHGEWAARMRETVYELGKK
jgi:putative hemolysin